MRVVLKILTTQIFMLLLIQASGHAQMLQQHVDKLYDIATKIKSVNVYSYDYTIIEYYPDSTADSVHGTVIADNTKKIMLNSNEEFDVYCNSEWFFRAIHSSKEVSVFRLEQKFSRAEKEKYIDELFSGQMIDQFVDSFVLGRAKLKSVQYDKNIISLVLTFPKTAMYLSDIDLKYDLKREMLVEMNYRIVYPWERYDSYDHQSEPKNVVKVMKCKNYKTTINDKVGDELFSVQKGKVVLKKFKDYKLNTL